MFTYLINDQHSLIERLVIIGDVITFYVKPFAGNLLGTANVVGGFGSMFEEHFDVSIIHFDDIHHINELHCCEGDTYYHADFAHIHFQFSKSIDKKMLSDIFLTSD